MKVGLLLAGPRRHLGGVIPQAQVAERYGARLWIDARTPGLDPFATAAALSGRGHRVPLGFLGASPWTPQLARFVQTLALMTRHTATVALAPEERAHAASPNLPGLTVGALSPTGGTASFTVIDTRDGGVPASPTVRADSPARILLIPVTHLDDTLNRLAPRADDEVVVCADGPLDHNTTDSVAAVACAIDRLVHQEGTRMLVGAEHE